MPDRLELHFQDYDAPPPQSDVETITSFLSASVGAVGHLLGQYDLVIGDLCVTISPDVVITVQNEVVRLGLHPDQAAHLDPLGGMAGKMLVDHEWRPVALVVGWAPGHPALWTMMAMAHELSHVLGLTIEHGLAGPTASYATIADYDGAVARAVADEYRADRFAAVLCEKGFAAIDDNGQPADIWEGRRQSFASNLDTLLDSVVPAVPDLVQAVRPGSSPRRRRGWTSGSGSAKPCICSATSKAPTPRAGTPSLRHSIERPINADVGPVRGTAT